MWAWAQVGLTDALQYAKMVGEGLDIIVYPGIQIEGGAFIL